MEKDYKVRFYYFGEGPDYPREHMLALTDRYLLEEVLGGDQEK